MFSEEEISVFSNVILGNCPNKDSKSDFTRTVCIFPFCTSPSSARPFYNTNNLCWNKTK